MARWWYEWLYHGILREREHVCHIAQPNTTSGCESVCSGECVQRDGHGVDKDRREQKEAAKKGVEEALQPGPTEGTKQVTGSALMHMTKAQQDEFVKQMNESLDIA